MLKELKEDVDKIERTMYGQNENIRVGKPKKTPQRNSGVKKYIN